MTHINLLLIMTTIIKLRQSIHLELRKELGERKIYFLLWMPIISLTNVKMVLKIKALLKAVYQLIKGQKECSINTTCLSNVKKTLWCSLATAAKLDLTNLTRIYKWLNSRRPKWFNLKALLLTSTLKESLQIMRPLFR